MAINYPALQAKAKATLQKFGAVPLIVRMLNNSTVATIGVFDGGVAKNIDTLQNPTELTGETGRTVYVPGIDFVIAGQTSTPQFGGYVEWYVNGVLYKKMIASVEATMPIPNIPILFTLGVE